MLGANHFKRKIAKKEKKKEAKKTASAEGPRRGGNGDDAPRAPNSGAAPGGKQTAAPPKSRNRSTLKGPVVAYSQSDSGRGMRDSANDRKGVQFRNKMEEKMYMRQHRMVVSPVVAVQQKQVESLKEAGKVTMTAVADATAPPKPSHADSRVERRQLRKAKSGDDLLDQFRTKLSASTFRLLNEQIYSSPNAFAGQLLRDPATFEDYHKGYRQQLVQWPVNPNSIIIDALTGDRRGRFLMNKAKSMPGYIPTSWVIADMGCGDAQVAKALKPKGYAVHSFDFCANSEDVVVADSSHVPLASGTVDVVVFSLSLMATDYFDNLLEAYRVLKPKRLLKIVEVRSRIPNPNAFAELVEGIGFTCDWFDVAGDYFIAYDFLKDDGQGPATQPVHYPGDVLLPSLYKKR